jgi:uncharacterized protein YndB with AHSA1/START domain
VISREHVTDALPPDSVSDAGFSLTRVFDAPRDRVWQEWTEPERFADWYGGTNCEVPLSTVSMDVRAGGEWRLTMYCGPGRREINWLGEYHEVVPPERLVFTVTDRPGDEGDRDLVTVVLADLGDGRTEMLVEQRDHMTAAEYERAMRGWGTFFDRIDERLAAQS